MSRLEHWAHRLFPKLTFDDFVERLEKLGVKKEIQVIKKTDLQAVVYNQLLSVYFLINLRGFSVLTWKLQLIANYNNN